MVMVPKIPGLPAGWTVREFRQSTSSPRDAVVLCERVEEDANHGTRFVVWSVNMIEGGCHGGAYVDLYEQARNELNRRSARLP